jgi:hypothetical protein
MVIQSIKSVGFLFEVDLLDGVWSDLILSKEEKHLFVLLIKKDLLHVIGIGKELVVLVDMLLLVDALLNLFLVFILLRMEDGEKSTHGLDLRLVLEMDGVVDLLLLENNDILCILVFNEVIALSFNALVCAFCSPSLCRRFEPTGIAKGQILIVYKCFDQLKDSRFINGRSVCGEHLNKRAWNVKLRNGWTGNFSDL